MWMTFHCCPCHFDQGEKSLDTKIIVLNSAYSIYILGFLLVPRRNDV
jgi:hypothetical protein